MSFFTTLYRVAMVAERLKRAVPEVTALAYWRYMIAYISKPGA